MKLLLQTIGRLAWWQKLIVGLLLIIILATWLGVCLILGSYLVP